MPIPQLHITLTAVSLLLFSYTGTAVSQPNVQLSPADLVDAIHKRVRRSRYIHYLHGSIRIVNFIPGDDRPGVINVVRNVLQALECPVLQNVPVPRILGAAILVSSQYR